MPRARRRWSPGAIHHAVARGHCGAPLFAADEDRAFLLARAARAFRESGTTCLAWSILVNHYHVLVRCDGPPGPAFARLNSALAWRESRRRGERGAVFQNRFHSDTCDDEESLLSRFAYILGNPIHHGVVPTVDALQTYPWSGLGEVMGLREARLADPLAALAVLHPDPARARETLLDVLERKAREWAGEDNDPGPAAAAAAAASASRLATASRRRRVHVAPAPRTDAADELRRRGLRLEGWTPERLVGAACALVGADPSLLPTGKRTTAEAAARAVAAFVACDEVGLSMVEVAPKLGVGPTALIEARRRGRRVLRSLGVSVADVLARRRGTTAPTSC